MSASILTCNCGEVIPDCSIHTWNNLNEYGYEVHTIEADCNKCNAHHDYETYNRWFGRNEAINHLQDTIDGIN